MKVHQLTNSLDVGDAVSTDCLRLAELLRELGFESQIFAKYVHPDLKDLVSHSSELGGEDSDLLLFHFCGASEVMDSFKQFPGRKLMKYHGITPPDFYRNVPGMERLARFCLEGYLQLPLLADFTDLGIGDSEYDRNELQAAGYKNTSVLPLAVELNRIRERPFSADVVEKYSRISGHKLLFVGRMAPNKRIDDLLRLLRAYKQYAPDAMLILVGSLDGYGPVKSQVLTLAEGLGLKEGCDFLFAGKVSSDQLYGYYRMADAYVCMSEHEGFCAPIVEAMTFGMPVFAYGAAAVPSTMGGAGECFEHKRWEEIAARMHAVLGDPQERARVVNRQYERLKEFDRQSVKERLASLLESAKNKPREDANAPVVTLDLPVSVVINTYNRATHLKKTLRSLQDLDYRNFEVVVVNGPSTDDTDLVLTHFPRTRVVKTTERNLSVSRNVGIRAARGDIIAFLDDDACPQTNWLQALVEQFADHTVGAVGGVVYEGKANRFQFKNGTIDLIGSVVPLRDAPGTFNDPNGFQFNTTMGTNSAFRRQALYEIGLFDEEFEYYHDEADISVRLIKQGWKVVHAPKAAVDHEFASGSNRANQYDLNWYAIVKNTLYFAIKNGPHGVAKLRHARRALAEVRQSRFQYFRNLRNASVIDEALYQRIRKKAIRGGLTGLAKGFFSPRRCHPQEFGKTEPIYPYLGFGVCLLSQDLPWERPGGIADYTWRLARGLAALDANVHLITRSERESDQVQEGVYIHGICVESQEQDFGLPASSPISRKNLSYSLRVAKKIKELQQTTKIHVVETPIWDAEGLAFALQKDSHLVVRLETGLAKAIETNGWELNEDLEFCIELEKELIARADGLIGISRHILESMRSAANPAALAEVIPIGIDTAADSDTTQKPAHSSVTVLYVGRLERRKGIEDLLKAIPSVLRECSEAQFVIAGRDGRPYGDQNTAQFFHSRVAPEISARVQFVGQVSKEKLEELYRDCDLFVAPSLYESFGIIFLEAMRAGKPVVGTRVGGIPEVVKDGATGLLVTPGDVEDLTTTLVRLIRNADLRERLGSAALDEVRSNFSEQNMFNATLEFYQRVVQRKLLRSTLSARAAAAASESTSAYVTETGPGPNGDRAHGVSDTTANTRTALLSHQDPASLLSSSFHLSCKKERGLNRICNLEDFSSQYLWDAIDGLMPGYDRKLVHRKAWEWGMGVYGIQKLAPPTRESMMLSVGGGTEVPIYYFSNLANLVFATDIYGSDEYAGPDNVARMLFAPEEFAGNPYFDRRRIVPRWADGRDLPLPSEFFDCVFSFSSIEHFGSLQDVHRAAREIGRVLKPGGLLCIATEICLNGSVDKQYFHDLFTLEDLQQCVISPSGCVLVEPLDVSVSPSTINTIIDLSWAAKNRTHVPHIVLRDGTNIWTSIIFFAIKPTPNGHPKKETKLAVSDDGTGSHQTTVSRPQLLNLVSHRSATVCGEVQQGVRDLIARHPLGTDSLVLDLGSSRRRVHPRAINVDLEGGESVDYACDITEGLPFEDNVFDLVICTAVLEHVSRPDFVVSEIHRVLRPGGLVWSDIPFLQPYHPVPTDYQRYTLEGIRYLFRSFDEVETGNANEVGSAMAWLLDEYRKVVLKYCKQPYLDRVFNREWAQFREALCRLDRDSEELNRDPESLKITGAVYFCGRKK